MHIHIEKSELRSGQVKVEFGSVAHRRGPWASWVWDGGRLEVAVDEYGHYPLFYAETAAGVGVSDSIAELLRLGVSNEFDDGAIAAFLRLGFFVAEDSPFRRIRAFPPGGRLTWSEAGGLRLERREIRSEVREIGREEAVRGLIERFREAIERSLPAADKESCLLLSGGRDSRHIAFELHRCGFQPGLVLSQHHLANRLDDDHEVAREVCQELQWRLEVLAQAEDVAAAELEKNRAFDCTTDEHGWFVPSAARIRAAGMRYVYDGVGGDVLSNGLFCRREWVELLERGREVEFCESVREFGASEEALRLLLKEPYQRRWSWSLATARIREELGRYKEEENPAHRFFFWNRTRREIAPFLCRFLPGVEVITPYLDRQVFDWLWNLPYDVMSDRRLHDEAIAVAFPQFAHLRYESKGLPSQAALHGEQMIKGMRRCLGLWRNGPVLNRWWLPPRLAGSLVRRRIGRTSSWYANWAMWLHSLEELAG